MKTEKIVLGVAGLAGLYLLTKQAGDPSSGGGLGGLAGDDENGLGDTVINFPDLDLSNIWGDSPVDPIYIDSLMTKKDIYQADPSNPFTTSEGLIRTADLGKWLTAQHGSARATPTLNARSTPYSIYDPVKKQSFDHHGGLTLPDPVKLGLAPRQGGLKVPSYVGIAPSPYKPPAPVTVPKKTYYAGPGKTWSL